MVKDGQRCVAYDSDPVRIHSDDRVGVCEACVDPKEAEEEPKVKLAGWVIWICIGLPILLAILTTRDW